ncbi:MAG: hypothetical protein K5930_01870 [Treponemataceae bacterium]|nr:hypothetical protein [Treponemataceae bacterium]
MTRSTTEIYNNLLTISKDSGTDFLDLSKNFPVMLRELDAISNRSSAAMMSLRMFSSIQEQLKNVVKAQEELLTENRKFLADVREKNNDLFTHFSEKMHLLDTIQDIIEGIKDGSQEMEVISLNAMVVSIKSGKAGQAFSYITSNLKHMSLRLISQSEQLIQDGTAVQDALKILKEEISKVNNLNQNSSAESYDSSSSMINAIEEISSKINSMLEDSKLVKNPIIKAMEGIQMQDIIRQSLDDVLIAVQKLSSPRGNLSPEEQLYAYNANEKLSTLCVRCLTKIKEKLDGSIEVFTKNRDEAALMLENIDKTKETFTNNDNESISGLVTLKMSIENAIDDFNGFSELFGLYQSVQGKVLEAVENIQEAVQIMALCFNGFLPIINNLQYVAIAQRIEVARNEAISSIKETVEYMAQLIADTKVNVDTAQKQLQEFTDTSHVQIQSFLQTASHNRTTFADVAEAKRVFSENLNSLYNGLRDAIRNFRIYSPDFYTSYEQIGCKIESLKNISERINKEIKSIKAFEEENAANKKHHMELHHLTDTGIHNADIEEFLHHFTITDDKLEAGSIAGISVTGGAESGEITFF